MTMGIPLTKIPECRWLIVYNNAEDPELIREYWPLAGRGLALITTMNPAFRFLADHDIEITHWDSENGSRILLHQLSSDISSGLKEEEATSAQQLSQKLSGHALAISTMAGLIHRRELSISEFMRFYNKHPSDVPRISGNRSIDALWEMSFQSLNAQSHALLGVMSFLEPDNISQALFEPPTLPEKLPKALEFCSDPAKYGKLKPSQFRLL